TTRAKVFGNEDSLVKRIRFAVITDKTPWIEIVGVVGHIRSVSLETDLLPQAYWPKAQLERISIACTGRLPGSVPRAAASALDVESRSLPLAVLTRTRN